MKYGSRELAKKFVSRDAQTDKYFSSSSSPSDRVSHLFIFQSKIRKRFV